MERTSVISKKSIALQCYGDRYVVTCDNCYSVFYSSALRGSTVVDCVSGATRRDAGSTMDPFPHILVATGPRPGFQGLEYSSAAQSTFYIDSCPPYHASGMIRLRYS